MLSSLSSTDTELTTRQMHRVLVNSAIAPLCTGMTESVLSTQQKFNALFISHFKINYVKLEYKTIGFTVTFSCLYAISLSSCVPPHCPLYLSVSHLAGPFPPPSFLLSAPMV